LLRRTASNVSENQRFPRIEGEPQQAWFGHKVNPIDPKVLDGYVGRYQVGPNLLYGHVL